MTAIKALIASALLCLSAASAQAQLTIAVPETKDSAGLRAIAGDFASVAGGANVNVVQAPYDELFQRAAKAGKDGSGEFDIILLDDPWIPFFAENNYLEDLTDYFLKRGSSAPDSDFLAPSLALCRNPYGTGRFICLPFVGNAQLFFYDWRLYESHDVFDEPAFWEDVITVGRGIKEKGNRRGEASKYGYVYRGTEGNPIVADFLPILWSYGGEVLDTSGAVTIDSAEARKALDVFVELAKYAPPDAKNYGADEIGESLAKGVSASSINWPHWATVFEDPDQSQVVGRIAYAPMPNGTRVGRSEIGHWVLGISADSKRKQQAFEFLMWATAPAQQKTAAEHGNPPVRFSVFIDPELTKQKKFRHYPVLMEAIQFSRPRPRHSAWVDMDKALGVQLSRTLQGKVSAADALSNAQKAIEAIVAKTAK